MFHSLIIVGGNKEKRKKYALKITREKLGEKTIKSHPDFLLITGINSIGIDQIKDLRKKLFLKPYRAKTKVALINEAEKLTIQAQNTLLKTLEEPPENSLIVLTAPQKNSLLPTIISRCQIIKLKEEINFKKNTENFPQVKVKRVGECLKISTLYSSTKQQAIDFLQQILFKERESLLEKPNIKKAENIHLVLQAINLVKHNVNPILTTGNLLIKLVK